jgi:acyl-CoA reductase-like NAD-dependent aldehyde dehydrogenase
VRRSRVTLPRPDLAAHAGRPDDAQSRDINEDEAMAYQSVNPFDNMLTRSFGELADAQLEAKLAGAAACFEAWRETSYAHHAKIVSKAAALLHDQAGQFATTMTLEMGRLEDADLDHTIKWAR